MNTSVPPLPISVGLVGYGYSGKTFHAPLISAEPLLRLTGVASSDAGKVLADLPDTTVYEDAEQMFCDPNIDLVVIATPNHTHAPLARSALAGGKHVIVDKPFALDLAEARTLFTEAERQKRLLSVFQNRRWDSDFLTIRSAIAAGEVGEVTHFESHFDRFRPIVKDRWREKKQPGGGLWYDLGPHLVDQALLLFGLPDSVQGNFACQRPGAETEDWAHVVLTYGNRRIILHADMLTAGGGRKFIVHGTAGTLLKTHGDQQETQLKSGMKPGMSGWGYDPDPLILFDTAGDRRELQSTPGDQRLYYQAIARAIMSSSENPVPPVFALAVMAVIEAALLSARTGAARPLSLLPHEHMQFERLVCHQHAADPASD